MVDGLRRFVSVSETSTACGVSGYSVQAHQTEGFCGDHGGEGRVRVMKTGGFSAT